MAAASAASVKFAAKSMGETSVQELSELPCGHGGNLFAARQAYPQAPEPWLDLSTGINPYPYPFANPPPESFVRLPEQEEFARSKRRPRGPTARPWPLKTIAAPGSQAIINWLPHLVSGEAGRNPGVYLLRVCAHAGPPPEPR